MEARPTTTWLDPAELRVGLGCMRLWTASDGAAAEATVGEALDAGITVFDTARTYGGPGGEPGGNERALGQMLRARGGDRAVRVVTKGGMRREENAWIPDGRARTIAADCEASLAALEGTPIDLFLLHAPDPSRSWSTALRALGRLLDEGLVARVGLSNVSRAQLDAAVATVPVAAVEIALSTFDDSRLRDGTVALCGERGITVIAHSPLGGPRRVQALRRNQTLRDVAARHDTAAEEVALAWLLDLDPHVVVIPGARTPGAVTAAVRAERLRLADTEREQLRTAFGRPRAVRVAAPAATTQGDVVLIMGIPGAGKSAAAARYVHDGYLRLNRDVRGGTLRELCAALDVVLENGARTVVLDNTWLTRASRSDAVEVAARHGVPIRCVWLDISLADAQRNVVERVLERRGSLPTPDEVRQFNGRDGMISPTAQMRARRELDPPSADEGFAAMKRVAFVRAGAAGGLPGVLVAASAMAQPDVADALRVTASRPHLVFDWNEQGSRERLTSAAGRLGTLVSGTVDASLCAHPGGPPVCWCRPALLGLPLEFARRRGVDPAQSLLIGTSAAHRSMAQVLGSTYVSV